MQSDQHRGRRGSTTGGSASRAPPTPRSAQAGCQGISLYRGPGAIQAWKPRVTALCNAPPTQYPGPSKGGCPGTSHPQIRKANAMLPPGVYSPFLAPQSRCGLNPGVIFTSALLAGTGWHSPWIRREGRMSEPRCTHASVSLEGGRRRGLHSRTHCWAQEKELMLGQRYLFIQLSV